MMEDFSNEELIAEIKRIEKIEALCNRWGEEDGENACRSQLRALRAESKVRADS